MAIRNDLSIDWSVTPRIITVDAPSTEITMQDLLDTLRSKEASLLAMDNPPIVDSSGKEPLDAVTKNGLTVALLDARLGFEARTDWTQCSFSGGNLVAFDGAQVTLRQITAKTPINPTPFVNIDRASSSSGTLQEQDALQYASYQNAVWIDKNSSTTGTAFPSGTREYPVNNAQDAVLIGQNKGFSTLQFIGNYNLGAGDNVTGFTLIGQNPTRTFLTLGTDAIISNVEIRECSVTGILDGNATIRECVIYAIDYFSGYVHNSVLTEYPIVLGNDAVALFLHCYSGVAGNDTPVIDMGGSGQSLGIRNYNGGIKITNRTGTDNISLDINSGQLKLDATCTAGDIYARGVFNITDESTGTCTLIRDGKSLIEQDNIPKQIWDYKLA